MRFRGCLHPSAFHILLDILTSLNKLINQKSNNFINNIEKKNHLSSSSILIHLSPETILFIIKHSNDEIQAFTHLNMSKIFYELILQSRDNNQILFSLHLPSLYKAFLSGKEGENVILRLMKPKVSTESFLSINIMNMDINIIHNIPIEVLPMSIMKDNYQEPMIHGVPDIVIKLPDTINNKGIMRITIDKLKSMEKYILITANYNGTLTFGIENDMFILQTLHSKLMIKETYNQTENEINQNKNFCVKVQSKHLSKALSMEGNSIESLLCCICDSKMLVFHSNLLEDIGSITYYIPVIIMESN